jgi:oxygen-dependent protoporphyrinogen oxidase
MKPVAIIGGGITGLTAAFRLQQAGIPVKVIEAGERAGGVIRSTRREGYLAESGPNSILETSPAISSLVTDLGLESRRIYSDPRAENRYIVRGGKPVNVPTSPLGMARTRLFSTGAKLRLLREPFVRRAAADAEESLAQFVRRRLGREFLDYAINPFVAGVYAGDPEKLSVKHAFPKLHALEARYRSLFIGQALGARERKRRGEISKQDAKKLSFDEGLQVLVDTLQARLAADLMTLSPVTRLEQRAGEWLCVSANSGARPGAFSAVLLALPAYALARLQIHGDSDFDLSSLGGVFYPPVAAVVLGFRRADVAHPLDGFGALVPEVERFNILGALFSSSLFPNRAPEGAVTISSFVGGARAPALASQTPDKLVEIVCRDLAAILGVNGRPTFEHVAFYPQAIPQYNVGYGVFKERMDALERQAPGVFVAGHARDGVSLGDSIVSGHNVASRIKTFLASRRESGAAGELQSAA